MPTSEIAGHGLRIESQAVASAVLEEEGAIPLLEAARVRFREARMARQLLVALQTRAGGHPQLRGPRVEEHLDPLPRRSNLDLTCACHLTAPFFEQNRSLDDKASATARRYGLKLHVALSPKSLRASKRRGSHSEVTETRLSASAAGAHRARGESEKSTRRASRLAPCRAALREVRSPVASCLNPLLERLSDPLKGEEKSSDPPPHPTFRSHQWVDLGLDDVVLHRGLGEVHVPGYRAIPTQVSRRNAMASTASRCLATLIRGA